MKINNKLVAVAVASALAAPASFAAQDTSGMQYTSAAEGFYASIRGVYNSNNSGIADAGGSEIGGGSSRFGVRGTNDLGNMEGFYQYEAGVDVNNGGGLKTRQGHVGLRGNFGEIRLGSFWNNGHNWVWGSTDVANAGSGSHVYSDIAPARVANAFQYTSPNLEGFQASFAVMAKDTSEASKDGVDGKAAVAAVANTVGYDINGDGTLGTTNVTVNELLIGRDVNGDGVVSASATVTEATYVVRAGSDSAAAVAPVAPVAAKDDENAVDQYVLAAKYDMAGFSLGVAYSNDVGALKAQTGTAQPAGAPRDAAPAVPAVPAAAITGQTTDGAAVDDVTARGGITKDNKNYVDQTMLAGKIGYAQDNWYVNAWYGVDNSSEVTMVDQLTQGTASGGTGGVAEAATMASRSLDDTTIISIAGGVEVGEINLYLVHETKTHSAFDDEDGSYAIADDPAAADITVVEYEDTTTVFGVQYNLGSNTRVWFDYAAKDYASDSEVGDNFSIGLRHDF